MQVLSTMNYWDLTILQAILYYDTICIQLDLFHAARLFSLLTHPFIFDVKQYLNGTLPWWSYLYLPAPLRHLSKFNLFALFYLAGIHRLSWNSTFHNEDPFTSTVSIKINLRTFEFHNSKYFFCLSLCNTEGMDGNLNLPAPSMNRAQTEPARFYNFLWAFLDVLFFNIFSKKTHYLIDACVTLKIP